MTAILVIIVIDRRSAILALLLLPLVALAVHLLLREPRRDLQSALAAINRVLAFLGSSRGEAFPGVKSK
jgi:hypothetical protein